MFEFIEIYFFSMLKIFYYVLYYNGKKHLGVHLGIVPLLSFLFFTIMLVIDQLNYLQINRVSSSRQLRVMQILKCRQAVEIKNFDLQTCYRSSIAVHNKKFVPGTIIRTFPSLSRYSLP